MTPTVVDASVLAALLFGEPRAEEAARRLEHRSLVARIGPDDQQRIGVLDALDRRIEEIGCPAERRIECRAVLPTVDMRRAEIGHQAFQRIHFLNRGEIAGDGADPVSG